jgi:ADP-heptose:LPS heptosyltransferase
MEQFVELGRRALDRGLGLVLVGGADDRQASRQAATQLCGHLGPRRQVHDLSGRLSLAGTIGVLAGAAAFVGNDSGPRHLAAAVGTPTVGIFWLSNVLAFGPLVGDSDRALVSQQVHCPVCGEEQVATRCTHDVSFVSPVTVDEVDGALGEVLAAAVAERDPARAPH